MKESWAFVTSLILDQMELQMQEEGLQAEQ